MKFFFSPYKNTNIIKNTKKSFKQKHVKDQNLSEEEKQKVKKHT